MLHGAQPNLNDVRKSRWIWVSLLQFTNQDEPSLAREFDKQPRCNTSLTHILVVWFWKSTIAIDLFHSYRSYARSDYLEPLIYNSITNLCIYKWFPCIFKLFSSIYKSFSCICKCSIYNYYMPTAHSLLWLVRSWSHGHLTKLILGCNITFKYSDSQQVRFVCSILNLNFWRGTQQKWIETKNSEEFGLLVKSWLGKENWENTF